MDLDEWEFIPDEGFLEIHDDGGNKIFSRKLWKVDHPNSMINSNYFKDPQFVDSTDQEPKSPDQETVKQIIETPISVEPIKIESPEPENGVGLQVFLKNTEENQENQEDQEFVEMKIDSLKFEEVEKRFDSDEEVVMWGEKGDDERLNIWKWGLNGIGAICSFGVAAATICIIVLGNGNKHNHHKISFQIYQDDNKRIEHTTKLNEVISAARGVPWNRAHIRYGGYVNAL
jgi:hypothetical protein